MGNSECGIGNELRSVPHHEAAVVRSVERPGSSIDMHQPIPRSAFRVPHWPCPRPTSSEGQDGPALIMPGRHGGLLEPRWWGALLARRRARSGTGLAGLACSEARAKRQSRPVRWNVAVRRLRFEARESAYGLLIRKRNEVGCTAGRHDRRFSRRSASLIHGSPTRQRISSPTPTSSFSPHDQPKRRIALRSE
jgi:hypothetical protein